MPNILSVALDHPPKEIPTKKKNPKTWDKKTIEIGLVKNLSPPMVYHLVTNQMPDRYLQIRHITYSACPATSDRGAADLKGFALCHRSLVGDRECPKSVIWQAWCIYFGTLGQHSYKDRPLETRSNCLPADLSFNSFERQ